MLEVLECIATLPRNRGEELRIEIQRPPNAPAVVALRLWRPVGGDRFVPVSGRGFTARNYEIAPLISALVAALDWLRRDEHARGVGRDRECARRRRQGVAGRRAEAPWVA
jgi:hypothetical protein